MNKDVLFSSKTDLWETPQGFFDMLDAEFGFTLDAAADAQNHKCTCYYTREQDGLKQPWSGTVWCNPPYGRQIGKWVQKASYENAVNNNTIVMLLPARTDTRWFHTYIYKQPNVETRFVRGRLKFGGSKNSAPFPSMVVIFKPKDAESASTSMRASCNAAGTRWRPAMRRTAPAMRTCMGATPTSSV